MTEILAIIPARGGSKGLPGKNTKLLAGYPLIAYSIKAALDSSLISRIIVSTDSPKIAEIALAFGAEVPFIRPTRYALDLSTDLEVFVHALEWLKKNENYSPDLVVQLRPTSPIRFLSDIHDSIEKLQNSSADSLRFVTEAFHTPYKMWQINEDQYIKPLLRTEQNPEPYNQPRQNLPVVYWQTGTLDVIKTKTITENHSMSGRKILPYIIEQKFAVDIDDLSSFERAEHAIQNYNCIKFQP